MDSIACLSMPDYAWVALCIAGACNGIAAVIFGLVTLRLIKVLRNPYANNRPVMFSSQGKGGGVGGSGPAPGPWVER